MKQRFFIIIMVLTSGMSSLPAQKQKLTLKEINDYSSTRITSSIAQSHRWLDDEHYLESDRSIAQTSIVEVKSGNKTKHVSPTMNDGLFIQSNRLIYLKNKERKVLLGDDSIERSNLVLSPDSNWVAYVLKNNLYAMEISSGKHIQFTSDGSDEILNGIVSWVYYEEILNHATAALWWSPDSKYLGFFRTDESKVPFFPIFDEKGQHGSLKMTRYPKAGDPNPEVKIGIASIVNKNVVWADFDSKTDQYFGKSFWSPDSRSLWVQWMPREQNQLKIVAIDINTGKKQDIYNEEQSTWVDWKDDVHFLSKQPGFILINDIDGWEQLYLYNTNGSLKNKITSGNFWGTKILHIDEAKQTIYFSARKESPLRTDLYSIKFNGTSLKRLTFGNYDHMINLSPNAKYFITRYSNVSTPTKISLVSAENGKLIREIADSKSAEFDQLELATTEVVWYTTPDGLKLPAIVTSPPNIDPAKKYPVLINIYGGPNRGNVVDRWWGGGSWRSYEGIISVVLDHRGSGHYGKKGLNYMHRNLGKYEIEDFTAFVKQYLYEKPYVDRSRIAIKGHSYGGYLTALSLTKAPEYFKYGIADAGVMDWKLYDSHYTERYMDTPESNPEGYKAGSVLTYVKNYQDNTNFMLIRHGVIDDNVHMQNSLQLIDQLEINNQNFEMILYPGFTHVFLGNKYAAVQNDELRFLYKYLLNKEVPEEILRKNR